MSIFDGIQRPSATAALWARFETPLGQKAVSVSKSVMITAMVLTALGGIIGLLSIFGGHAWATGPMNTLHVVISSPWNKIMTAAGVMSFKVILFCKRRTFSYLGCVKQIMLREKPELKEDKLDL